MHDIDDNGRRRLLWLAGGQARGEGWVGERLGGVDAGEILWVAESVPPSLPLKAVPAHAVNQHLGSECRLLVVNAHQGFHPDAFAAALGTLRGGGDCVLLTPPVDEWAGFDDPDRQRFAAYPRSTVDMRGLFVARLIRLWKGHAAVTLVTPDSGEELHIAPAAVTGKLRLTAQQQQLVGVVEQVAHGHARRPLVLTADRGRGKSTLLGVSAARLLRRGVARITVVAPGRAAVATLYRHARATAGMPVDGGIPAELRIGDGRLCFRLPSEWRDGDGAESSLVLVDEAAAIPVAQLVRLLRTANRLVFASTVHGYEGSGRGFELRFRRELQRHMPQWRAFHLSEPVRWAADDPLEGLLNRSLLLDAELTEPTGAQPLTVTRIDVRQLADDEPRLRAVVALLVNAHYQTRPSDLRQLLDNPDGELWLASAGGEVLGVLLGVLEGGFDAPMAGQVLAAQRRPRGHLLAQSLAVHAGLDDCLTQRVLRVQRIAVHPQRRRGGIGSRLLDAAGAWAADNAVDLLGCAFGVELPLLAFWQDAGMRAVRLGLRVDPASATHSLFMLRALSVRGEALVAVAVRRFLGDMPWALGGSLRDIDSQLALALMAGRDCSDLALNDDECRDLARIVAGARQPATAEALVW